MPHHFRVAGHPGVKSPPTSDVWWLGQILCFPSLTTRSSRAFLMIVIRFLTGVSYSMRPGVMSKSTVNMRVNVVRCSSSTFLVVMLMLLAVSLAAGQQPQASAASKTKIVLLGTGNPGPDPDRSGPATAIVVNDTAYLVDFGPGVVRRASAAFSKKISRPSNRRSCGSRSLRMFTPTTRSASRKILQ